MRILSKPTRTSFYEQAAHADAKAPLLSWHALALKAAWPDPAAVKADFGTPDGDRLDVLAILVEAYEARHFPMELPSPIDAIKFSMAQKGLAPKELEPMIGRLNRVDEILNGKRPLTLPMIVRLNSALGIPAEVLIRQGLNAA